jgi:hypothetical protein
MEEERESINSNFNTWSWKNILKKKKKYEKSHRQFSLKFAILLDSYSIYSFYAKIFINVIETVGHGKLLKLLWDFKKACYTIFRYHSNRHLFSEDTTSLYPTLVSLTGVGFCSQAILR